MKLKTLLVGAAMSAAAALSLAGTANAAHPLFVGSWEVDQGPYWGTQPLAYTGQEAAALLFGGSPSNYSISTVDSNPADINHMAWYSVIGYYGNQGNGGSLLAENYSDKYAGQYYGPACCYNYGDPNAAASAYVWDNAQGSTFINYAFLNRAVPEPTTWAMLITGMFGLGYALRRRSAIAAA
jgi:hypothetical protein